MNEQFDIDMNSIFRIRDMFELVNLSGQLLWDMNGYSYVDC